MLSCELGISLGEGRGDPLGLDLGETRWAKSVEMTHAEVVRAVLSGFVDLLEVAVSGERQMDGSLEERTRRKDHLDWSE